MFRIRTWAAAALAACTGVLGLGLVTPAEAVPVRGNTGWSVLLCKFQDKAQEPKDAQFFREFLTADGAGLGGLHDYFADQSQGKVSLAGSAVRGWYTMPYTLEQQRGKDRWTKIQDCVGTAANNGYTVPNGHRVVAILNDWVDSGAAGDRVLLDPGAWNVGFAAHEMLHGYGLMHSFSDDPTYRNVEWAQIGEYDNPWDIQSAMNIHTFQTQRFGTSAVGLGGYFRDKLGWLPRHRITTFGADGVGSRTLQLTALETPGTPGTQLLRIPFDPADLNRYYTVEYRRKTGNSAGIPGDVVLLNEVKNGTPYLLRTRGGDRHPVRSLNANGVSVRIDSLNGDTATVTVTSDIVRRCVQGHVWREAKAGDQVCVTPAVRSQAAADNAAAGSRWVNGPHGPHTCVQGYVWREAVAGDDVCVTPANRQQARDDNAAAASRANPARLVHGQNACKTGYVWREADAYDYVCVTGAVRQQNAADNAAAPSRWVNGPWGPHTCVQGYVWRDAWPGDDVCVTPANRQQAWNDNAEARNRIHAP
ncbi:hypothetical protein JOF53_005102 [Crossiella equi]|uniref:Uncharacterized protein n=1 Tax=Crossiella equi TaxID=130796 RepID=A0ABS5AKP8_9PSEU|nr:hypothetical protein [Crossiella equi]MBP2476230.1 hypothetical protein [Crossiella equi]